MKKIIPNLLLFFACITTEQVLSQGLTYSTPTVACINQTVISSVSTTNQAVSYFSWGVAPQQQITPTNFSASQVLITYTTCGVHTITCTGFDIGNNPVPGASFSETVNVHCSNPPQLFVVSTYTSVCPGYSTTLTAGGANTYTWYPGGIVQPSCSVPAGTYTVIGANTIGCESPAEITIGSQPPLNISVSQSSSTTCIISNTPKVSKPVHLTASGASSYVWFPYNPAYTGAEIDVRPPASTCFTVVGTTAVCSGTAITCVTVTPQFSASIDPPATTICSGDAIPLKVVNIGGPVTGSVSAFTYSWTEALNAPPVSMSSSFGLTVSVFPQNTTTYTVEVSDAATCVSLPAFASVTVTTCTGLSEKAGSKDEVQLYPNPAKDHIMLRADKAMDMNIEVVDATGKVIVNQQSNLVPGGLTQRITISTLPSGFYFVKIFNGSREIRTLKLVKE